MHRLHTRLSRRTLVHALALGSVTLLPAVRRQGAVPPAPGADTTAQGSRPPLAPLDRWARGDHALPSGRRAAELVSARLTEDDDTFPLYIPANVRDDEAWVLVNLTALAAVGMIGRLYTHVAPVTTGKPGWETPEGEFRIVRRVANETMTSASLNIRDPNDQYVLTNVLYTQYFTWEGHAFHLNYWRPDSVFGNERTSHGCVGMRLDDAKYFWDYLSIGSRVVIHS